MRNRFLLATLSWLAATGMVHAKPLTLTLDQAVSKAMASQPQIRQAMASLEASQARQAGVRSATMPQVSLNSGYQANTNTVPGAAGMSMGANLSQLLYDFGQTGHRVDAAEATTAAQNEALKNSRQQVAFNVRSAYLEAQAARALLNVARENLTNQQRHLDQVQRMVQIGSRAPIDLAQTRKDLANSQVQLIRAENAYATSKAELNQSMGEEGSLDFDVAATSVAPVPGESQPVETLLREALSQRPEVAALQYQQRSSEASLKATKTALSPSLRASAAASNGGNLFATNPVVGAGLSLSRPLWNGGSTHAQVAEGEANLSGLAAQVDSQRLQIRLEIVQAQLGIQSGQAAVKAAAESVKSAQEQLRLAEGRYEAGVGNIIELSDAQLAVTTARGQLIQEEQHLSLARAQLLRALGRP